MHHKKRGLWTGEGDERAAPPNEVNADMGGGERIGE